MSSIVIHASPRKGIIDFSRTKSVASEHGVVAIMCYRATAKYYQRIARQCVNMTLKQVTKVTESSRVRDTLYEIQRKNFPITSERRSGMFIWDSCGCCEEREGRL